MCKYINLSQFVSIYILFLSLTLLHSTRTLEPGVALALIALRLKTPEARDT